MTVGLTKCIPLKLHNMSVTDANSIYASKSLTSCSEGRHKRQEHVKHEQHYLDLALGLI